VETQFNGSQAGSLITVPKSGATRHSSGTLMTEVKPEWLSILSC
jgi:hypothetical protein